MVNKFTKVRSLLYDEIFLPVGF